MSVSSRGSDARSAAASNAGGSHKSPASHRSHHRRQSSTGSRGGIDDITESDQLFELMCNKCETSFQGMETVIPDCNCMLCPDCAAGAYGAYGGTCPCCQEQVTLAEFVVVRLCGGGGNGDGGAGSSTNDAPMSSEEMLKFTIQQLFGVDPDFPSYRRGVLPGAVSYESIVVAHMHLVHNVQQLIELVLKQLRLRIDAIRRRRRSMKIQEQAQREWDEYRRATEEREEAARAELKRVQQQLQVVKQDLALQQVQHEETVQLMAAQQQQQQFIHPGERGSHVLHQQDHEQLFQRQEDLQHQNPPHHHHHPHSQQLGGQSSLNDFQGGDDLFRPQELEQLFQHQEVLQHHPPYQHHDHHDHHVQHHHHHDHQQQQQQQHSEQSRLNGSQGSGSHRRAKPPPTSHGRASTSGFANAPEPPPPVPSRNHKQTGEKQQQQQQQQQQGGQSSLSNNSQEGVDHLSQHAHGFQHQADLQHHQPYNQQQQASGVSSLNGSQGSDPRRRWRPPETSHGRPPSIRVCVVSGAPAPAPMPPQEPRPHEDDEGTALTVVPIPSIVTIRPPSPSNDSVSTMGFDRGTGGGATRRRHHHHHQSHQHHSRHAVGREAGRHLTRPSEAGESSPHDLPNHGAVAASPATNPFIAPPDANPFIESAPQPNYQTYDAPIVPNMNMNNSAHRSNSGMHHHCSNASVSSAPPLHDPFSSSRGVRYAQPATNNTMGVAQAAASPSNSSFVAAAQYPPRSAAPSQGSSDRRMYAASAACHTSRTSASPHAAPTGGGSTGSAECDASLMDVGSLFDYVPPNLVDIGRSRRHPNSSQEAAPVPSPQPPHQQQYQQMDFNSNHGSGGGRPTLSTSSMATHHLHRRVHPHLPSSQASFPSGGSAGGTSTASRQQQCRYARLRPVVVRRTKGL